MSRQVKCFMLEPTGLVRDELRRWSTRDCPLLHTHDARVVVCPSREAGPGECSPCDTADLNLSDPRWPTRCACGYEFTPDDHWQVFSPDLWRCPDGSLISLAEAPPGAMWFADWMAELGIAGPDGRVLVVALPPNGGLRDQWIIDQKSQNGSGWTRTGTPPEVTANPSILTPRYHGWLRAGHLEEC